MKPAIQISFGMVYCAAWDLGKEPENLKRRAKELLKAVKDYSKD